MVIAKKFSINMLHVLDTRIIICSAPIRNCILGMATQIMTKLYVIFCKLL